MKDRHNLYIENKTWSMLEDLAKNSHKSISHLIEYAVVNTYQDPLKVLEEENKELREKLIMNSTKAEEIKEKRRIRAMTQDPRN